MAKWLDNVTKLPDKQAKLPDNLTLTGMVSVNNSLLTVTVPINKELLTRMVVVNNSIQINLRTPQWMALITACTYFRGD